MAQLGQCKTCRTMVSMEALTCPRCGQPNPGISVPLNTTIHSATVTEIEEDNDGVSIGLTLQSGLWAVDVVNSIYIRKYQIGQTVQVRIYNSNRGVWSLKLID